MSSSQTNNQISGRIYGILTNSVSGAVAIMLFLLFLPKELIDIEEIPLYLINNDLVTAPVLFIFVVLSYIIGQMVQAYTSFIPFRYSISRILYFFPLIPQFERDRVRDSYRERFSWTCDKLFYGFDDINQPSPIVDLSYESMNLASSYLRNKDVSEVQIYEDISSSFSQLELLVTTSLILSLFILHPKNIDPGNIQTSAFFIPIYLVILSVFSYILKVILGWVTWYRQESRSHQELDEKELSRNINIELLFKQLSGLLIGMAIVSTILLMLPFDIEYSSNLEALSGSFSRYTPLLFFVLTYSSTYVEARYSNMRKMVIISDLYPVAISEGDIGEIEQD